MSDALTIAAATAAGAIGGSLIASIGIIVSTHLTNRSNRENADGERNERLEEKRLDVAAREAEAREGHRQWFEKELFGRQLAAIAEAYAFLIRFNDLLNARPYDNQETAATLVAAAKDARTWYQENALFLFDGLPGSSHFVGAINSADGAVRVGGMRDVFQLQNDAFKELRERAAEVMNRARPRVDTLS